MHVCMVCADTIIACVHAWHLAVCTHSSKTVILLSDNLGLETFVCHRSAPVLRNTNVSLLFAYLILYIISVVVLKYPRALCMQRIQDFCMSLDCRLALMWGGGLD